MTENTLSEVFLAKIPTHWKEVLKPLIPVYKLEHLANCVLNAYEHGGVSPDEQYSFRAFELVEPNEVKVVILGHDPYANPSLARGLSFAIPESSSISDAPSMKAIKDELINEYSDQIGIFDQSLTTWASQGVLLMNTLLTVEDYGMPGSHGAFGWQCLSDAVLRYLDEKNEVVFLLWGSKARAQVRKRNMMNAMQDSRVLEAFHPSYQKGKQFSGCNCFKEANRCLKEKGIEPIQWLG